MLATAITPILGSLSPFSELRSLMPFGQEVGWVDVLPKFAEFVFPSMVSYQCWSRFF